MHQCGVYILESLQDGKYYIGCTTNINKRFQEHNQGKVRSTKNYLPWKLLVLLPCETEQEAHQNERRLKRYKNKGIFMKVARDGIFPWNF